MRNMFFVSLMVCTYCFLVVMNSLRIRHWETNTFYVPIVFKASNCSNDILKEIILIWKHSAHEIFWHRCAHIYPSGVLAMHTSLKWTCNKQEPLQSGFHVQVHQMIRGSFLYWFYTSVNVLFTGSSSFIDFKNGTPLIK